jgi:hypothetical protein
MRVLDVGADTGAWATMLAEWSGITYHTARGAHSLTFISDAAYQAGLVRLHVAAATDPGPSSTAWTCSY